VRASRGVSGGVVHHEQKKMRFSAFCSTDSIEDLYVLNSGSNQYPFFLQKSARPFLWRPYYDKLYSAMYCT